MTIIRTNIKLFNNSTGNNSTSQQFNQSTLQLFNSTIHLLINHSVEKKFFRTFVKCTLLLSLLNQIFPKQNIHQKNLKHEEDQFIIICSVYIHQIE